jgi:hypothetical protein
MYSKIQNNKVAPEILEGKYYKKNVDICKIYKHNQREFRSDSI